GISAGQSDSEQRTGLRSREPPDCPPIGSWAACGKGIMRDIGCHPEDHVPVSRRQLVQAGAMSLLGTGLADLLRLQAHAIPQPQRARAKAVVFIFQSGGPSQHETFDPKPDAPEGIRGEYGTTQTRLVGVRFCEHLPRLAARADRFAVVRTM